MKMKNVMLGSTMKMFKAQTFLRDLKNPIVHASHVAMMIHFAMDVCVQFVKRVVELGTLYHG